MTEQNAPHLRLARAPVEGEAPAEHGTAAPAARNDEDWGTLVDQIIGEVDALVDGFPASERADAARGVYRDADGGLRTRHGMLRPVRDADNTGADD